MIAKLVFSQCLESLVARIEKLVLSPPQNMADIDAIAQCAEALHPVYFALNTMGDCPISIVNRLLEACLTAELVFADIAVQVFYNTQRQLANDPDTKASLQEPSIRHIVESLTSLCTILLSHPPIELDPNISVWASVLPTGGLLKLDQPIIYTKANILLRVLDITDESAHQSIFALLLALNYDISHLTSIPEQVQDASLLPSAQARIHHAYPAALFDIKVLQTEVQVWSFFVSQ